MILNAYAKINLSLDLVGKRDDGYHLLRTVMQTVTLHDIISLEAMSCGIGITCNKKYIPTDNRNIVYKIAQAFFDYTGIKGGVRIGLKKYIPCGAGLGGGSADGAAVLDGLCELYGVSMTAEQKVGLTQDIGADIPFFFYGGTALCEGIGEKVTPLADMPECWMVIAKPPVSLSTPAIFKSPLTAGNFGGDSTEGIMKGISNGDVSEIAHNCKNALEPASLELCPKIQNIKDGLVKSGALTAMMSGSGSAVFGIFKSHREAQIAYFKQKRHFKEVYIVKPISLRT